jgi:molecular chaperone DnaK (HSP70)
MKIIANKFNRKLGCKNFDEVLLAFYANLFDSRNSSAEMNLMENKKSVLKLLESIERQRKILSGVHEHDLSIECILEDYDLAYTMKR